MERFTRVESCMGCVSGVAVKSITIIGTGPSLLSLQPHHIRTDTVIAINDAILRLRELKIATTHPYPYVYVTQKEGIQAEPQTPEILILSEFSDNGWEAYPYRMVIPTTELDVPADCVSITYAIAIAHKWGYNAAIMLGFDSHWGDTRRLVDGIIDSEVRRNYLQHDREAVAYAESIGFELDWQQLPVPTAPGHRDSAEYHQNIGHRTLITD